MDDELADVSRELNPQVVSQQAELGGTAQQTAIDRRLPTLDSTDARVAGLNTGLAQRQYATLFAGVFRLSDPNRYRPKAG